MREWMKMLYRVAGSYSGEISRMVVFDVFKGMFEGVSLGAILLCLGKVCEGIFEGRTIVSSDILTVAALSILGVAGKILFGYLSDRNKYRASYSMGEENRLLIGDRLKQVPMGYFSEHSLGDVSGGLSAGVGELETFGVLIVEQMLVGMIQTSLMMLFMIPFDPVTGGIIFLTLLAGTGVNLLSQKRVDRLTERLLGLKLKLNSRMLEYVRGIGVTKAFGTDEKTLGELNDSISESRRGFLAVEKILVPVQFLFLSVFKLGIFAIIFAALTRFMNGSLPATKAMMLIISSFVVFSGFELAGSMQSIRGVAIRNLKTVLELRELPRMEEGEKEELDRADIRIDRVDFSYDETPLFEELSLTVPEGKTTAVVGFSGSGKTTLCNLMARFWDVRSGTVSVGDSDVRDYKYDALLAHFSFVFQDVVLFDDTVRNNLKFGNPDASDEEMIEVAKKARCHDFIMKLPEGYDTVLQEGGSNLSGGERQRLSIARAMLKPSRFVILDEATSSIDPENETELLLALRELLKDKTVIVIAHKLATVRHADRIVVLDDGKIVQEGTHDELVKQEGVYRRFVEIREQSENWTV